MKAKVVLFSLLFLAGSSVLASEYETEKTLTLAAEGIRILDVDAGAGSLAIEGREGAPAIEVKAEIHVSGVRDQDIERYLEDRMELTLRKSGDRAVLVGRFRKKGIGIAVRDTHIDLTVIVPKRMALEIDDGSGGIEIANIAARISIDDGSGSFHLRDAAGDILIDDSSGDIRIEGVEGSVEIDDSSGDIRLVDVTGDVLIDDGSGSMTIRAIGGKVTVSDGSGSIDIDGVGGDVHLRRTGSGGVDVTNVKGKVIRND